MPSCVERWNTFRPEIKPVPPARLLMTAVAIASEKSFWPELFVAANVRRTH